MRGLWLAALVAALITSVHAGVAEAQALERRPAPPTLPGTDEIFRTIEELVALGPRRTGTPAGTAAAEYVRDRLRSYGVRDAHIEETPTYAWTARHFDLKVAGHPIDAFPAQHTGIGGPTWTGTVSTGPGGRTAPIVDVGLGTAPEMALRDVRGKIVVFDLKFLLPLAGLAPVMEYLWDPTLSLATPTATLLQANPYITTFADTVKTAMEQGAVGFVGVLSDYFDSNRYFNEYYRRTPMTIPGLWVTRREGARLRTLMRAAGPAATATLTLEAERRQVPAKTVVGALPGKTTDAIMIQSHHDSVSDGAVEDASGVAEVLALARHFSRVPRAQREKTLLFTTFDSHFTGYHAHIDFARRHIQEPQGPRRIVANVTLEHIAEQGVVGADGRLELTGMPEPRGVFETLSAPLKGELIAAITRNDLRRTAVLNGTPFQVTGLGIPTDASFAVITGVPTASLIAGPLYLYDAADTLDKVDRDELQPVAQAFAELVDAIDATPASAIAQAEPEESASGETAAGSLGLPSARRCRSRRAFPIRIRTRGRRALAGATVFVGGRSVRTRRASRSTFTARIDLRGRGRGRVAVRIVARTKAGRVLRSTRTYRLCGR